MTDLNVWINKAGKVRPCRTGAHATDRKRGDVIRVSTPERRRTWLGIEVSAGATAAAKAALRPLIQAARRQGLDIIADIDGRIVETMQHDRPTELNRAISD